MRVWAAVLATVIYLSSHSPAPAMTAGELLGHCEELERAWVIQGKDVSMRPVGTVSAVNAGKCWGYLEAYFDISYLRIVDPIKPNVSPTALLNVCPPSGVNLSQFIRMFLQKARASPAQLHNGAFFMIQNMLVEAFPCPN